MEIYIPIDSALEALRLITMKGILVSAHNFLFAFAFAGIALSHVMMFVAHRHSLSEGARNMLGIGSAFVLYSLYLLLATGFAIVAIGVTAPVAPNALPYLANEKLWMKVVVVFVITVDAWFVHRFVLPPIMRGLTFLQLSPGARRLAVICGVVSGVSWTWAAYLGTARDWNHKASFEGIMTLYMVSLAATLIVVLIAMRIHFEILAKLWYGVRMWGTGKTAMMVDDDTARDLAEALAKKAAATRQEPTKNLVQTGGGAALELEPIRVANERTVWR